jgi:hypothetical protein
VEKLRVEHMDSFTSGDVDKDGQLSAPEFLAVMITPPVAINTLTRWAKKRFSLPELDSLGFSLVI